VTVEARHAALARLARFVVDGEPPPDARARALLAVLDTVGVTLAGAVEPASRIVQRTIDPRADGPCGVIGTAARASAADAALANGTAAHALDFDDMCFVSLAHPSAPLVPAALAAGELAGASGAALLDAYVIGFEIEARLGRAMNPRHYQRGWHCTSTLGTIGAAAAAARLLGLDEITTGHALAISASEASGLKENFGTMTKPLHAGLAARAGVFAAQLAAHGLTASRQAIDGAQGYLVAMDSERRELDDTLADLGTHWEIVATGITVKLYPSCAGTHPTLDVLLDVRREMGFSATDVERVEIGVDGITPTVLLYDQPSTGLEAKFSMPFCAAVAIVEGAVGVSAFDDEHLKDGRIRDFMPRVSMRVDSTLDPLVPSLTQANVTVVMKDGRRISRDARGARGYAERPASASELDGKFLNCASRVLDDGAAAALLAMLRDLERLPTVGALTEAARGRASRS
jgi:2-methylcitrate dehydratase PrpD